MPKEITHPQVKTIAEIIREWPKQRSLTWESICVSAEGVLGYKPTRQGLNKKPMLVNAYRQKKKQIKSDEQRITSVARPQSMLEAMERIARLQEENQNLKAELSKMAEVAQRFIYNASIAGLPRSRLMEPMPSKK